MNKLIKQLAKDSDLIRYDSDGNIAQVEKFAELIVKECAKVIRKNTGKMTTIGYEYFTPSECADMIEYHFGVAE